MNLDTFARQTADKFAKRFGRQPRWIAAAPGRVNIIGEHTDYNDGFVFPMAIERYTVLAADRPVGTVDSPRILLTDANLEGDAVVNLDEPLKPGQPKWANYVKGVIAGFQRLGADLGSLDVMIDTSVPLGGGLSSSAAFEVSSATLFEAVTGKTLDPVDKALLCQKAEHEFAGMPCGIMDQFISVMGKANHVLLLDCRSRKTELVPMSDPEVSVLIINTNVKHELTGSEYPTRRKQCETAASILGVPALRDATMPMLEAAKAKMDPVVFRRARHIIGEIERTTTAAKAISSGNWPEAGRLMYASHYSLKDDYEVSCAELDVIVEIAQSIGFQGGVIGCRMTGGGFGGCAVALVKNTAIGNISQIITEQYQQRTQIKPTLFVSRPAHGAKLIKG
ncbi:MAG: galactokinase [Verrucomicrobiota bacterium]